MKAPNQMLPVSLAAAPTLASGGSVTGVALLSVSKIGQIDMLVKSTIYRELKTFNGRIEAVSMINVIDLDDKTKYRLSCSTFLERELLAFGPGIVDKKIRIINLGQEPGKKWFRLQVTEITAHAAPLPPVQNPAIMDDDISF